MTSTISKLTDEIFDKQNNRLSVESEEDGNNNKLSKSTSTRTLNKVNEQVNTNFINRQSIEFLKKLLENFLLEYKDDNIMNDKQLISRFSDNIKQQNTNFQFDNSQYNATTIDTINNHVVDEKVITKVYAENTSYYDDMNYEKLTNPNINSFAEKLYEAILYIQTRKICRKLLKYFLIDSQNVEKLQYSKKISTTVPNNNDNSQKLKLLSGDNGKTDQNDQSLSSINEPDIKPDPEQDDQLIEESKEIVQFENDKPNWKDDLIIESKLDNKFIPIEAEVIYYDEFQVSNQYNKEAIINIEDCPTYKSQLTTISSILEKDDLISLQNLVNNQTEPSPPVKENDDKPIETVKFYQKVNPNKSKSASTSNIFQKPSVIIKKLFRRNNRSMKRNKRDASIHRFAQIQSDLYLKVPERTNQIKTTLESTKIPKPTPKVAESVNNIYYTKIERSIDESQIKPVNKPFYDEISIEFSS